MPKPPPAPVPLESGDRLTREEFHRRYCLRPDIARAELVQGVVYVASPTRYTLHGEQHGAAVRWLGTYAAARPGVAFADNTTGFLGPEDEVQPDACLFRLAPGGGVRVTDDGYLEGAPELVVAVVASSAGYDLHDKLQSYRRAGVQKYAAWQVYEGRYVPPVPDARRGAPRGLPRPAPGRGEDARRRRCRCVGGAGGRASRQGRRAAARGEGVT